MRTIKGKYKISVARRQLLQLWHKYQGVCQYCKKPTYMVEGCFAQRYNGNKNITGLYKASRDHIKPTSKGGSDILSNLTLACSLCNNNKGDMTVEEFETIKLWGCDADYFFRLEHSLRGSRPSRGRKYP